MQGSPVAAGPEPEPRTVHFTGIQVPSSQVHVNSNTDLNSLLVTQPDLRLNELRRLLLRLPARGPEPGGTGRCHRDAMIT